MKFGQYALILAVFVLFAAAPVAAADEGGAAAVDPSQIKGLQEQMLSDPGTMALIMALQNDPEVQALLADPKVLEAAQRGDFGALLNDPRFQRLLENPQVKEIGKRLDKREGGGER